MFTFVVCLSVLLGAIACVLVLFKEATAPIAKPATDPHASFREAPVEPEPVAEPMPQADLATVGPQERVRTVASPAKAVTRGWRPAEGVVEQRSAIQRMRSALNLALLLAALGAGLAVGVAVLALGLQVLLQRAAGV